MNVDWEDLERSLGRFSRATGLCVSGYDERGMRQVGPVHDSRVAALLVSAGAFDVHRVDMAKSAAIDETTGEAASAAVAMDGVCAEAETRVDAGAAYRIECELVRQVLDTQEAAGREIAGDLSVLGAPIVMGGALRGVLVYGWVFPSFGTPLGCQRLALELGVDPVRLWSVVRLTPPVPPARLVVFTELLETILAAAARHEEALERINAMGRLREVFLAGVSHELRTPLSAISLRTEVLLQKGGLPEPVVAFLLKIRQHVAEEARLVDDLIEASRTRTGQLTVERRAVSLDDVLAGALAAISPQADAKNIEVTTQGLYAEGQRKVLADPHRLQQVFWNLLSNAVKFTAPGGRVLLSLSSDDEAHEVAVTDTGRGIDPELLPSIFDAFQKTTHRNEKGLGLGLSIARHIVERHGGTLVAHSDGADAGSRFVVRIPAIESDRAT